VTAISSYEHSHRAFDMLGELIIVERWHVQLAAQHWHTFDQSQKLSSGSVKIIDDQRTLRDLLSENRSHFFARGLDSVLKEHFSHLRHTSAFACNQFVHRHGVRIAHQSVELTRQMLQTLMNIGASAWAELSDVQHCIAFIPDGFGKKSLFVREVGVDRYLGHSSRLSHPINRSGLKAPLKKQVLCSPHQCCAFAGVFGATRANGVGSISAEIVDCIDHCVVLYLDFTANVEPSIRFPIAIPYRLLYLHIKILVGLVFYWRLIVLTVALRMLTGDRAKYIGLIFGVAFATLLMSQQVSIFIGLMTRTANQVLDVRDADIWVMDPRVNYVDEVEPLRDIALQEVRGVAGVGYAVPLYKGLVILRTTDGLLNQINLIGVDTASLTGAPRRWVSGSADSLRQPNAIVFDGEGAKFIWPKQTATSHIGRVAEINDKRVVVTGVADVRPTFITFPVAYMKYSDVMALLPPQRKAMSFVLVRGVDGSDPTTLARKITAETGLQALTREDFAWRSVRYYLQRTGIPVNFGITILLGLIVGIAITGQTFVLFVFENMKQFGALKAIGVTNQQILAMIFTQAGMVGLIGFGIGIGSCSLFFKLTSDKAPALKGFFLPDYVIAGTAAIVLMIMVISVLGSVQRLMRVDPAIVFRG
jgi:putative ABC transport system permease protein